MRLAFILGSAILLSSCGTYTKTVHSFDFYGSTQESYGREFFYIAYGVLGDATAKYSFEGWDRDMVGGEVRNGLIADAKRDLMRNYPLGSNQCYVNLSIDVSTTETGDASGVERRELKATISADIIEFGTPPEDYRLPVDGLKLSYRSSTHQTQQVRENGAVKLFDVVSFSSGAADNITGEVIELIPTPNGTIAKVEYVENMVKQLIVVPVSNLKHVSPH